MGYLYFPGCTLKDESAAVMEKAALLSAGKLGLELEEMEEWQCCGAVYPLTEDEIITLLSPSRTLFAARGEPVVTLCSACHHVLKRTRERLFLDKGTRDKIISYLEDEYSFPGEMEVLHFLELLRDKLGWEALSQSVESPLQGRRMAAYYGCMLLRPEKEMTFDNPERPRIMEDYLQALGAEVVTYPFRNRCCGACLALTQPGIVEDTSQKIVRMAASAGAEELTTACPLCHYNLEKTPEAREGKIKISYFSEPLAEALNLQVQEVAPK